MKDKTIIPDWAIALSITFFFTLLFIIKLSFLESLELRTYDLRMKLFPPASPGKEIAIVAIDDESIAKLGRWPWPRTRVAEVTEWLAKAGAKVIGINILFSEPEESSGLTAINSIEERFMDSGLFMTPEGQEFIDEMDVLRSEYNRDKALEEVITGSGKVVFPLFFNFPHNEQQILNKAKPPDYLTRSGIPNPIDISMPVAAEAISPLEPFSRGAVGLGHVNRFPDPDGVSRWENTFVKFGEELYPSFPLSLVWHYVDINKADISISEEGVNLGGRFIPLVDGGKMLINYYGPSQTFPYYSFYDVINQKVDPAAFSNKIVLVGMTGMGLGVVESAPVDPVLPSIEKMANVIANILNQEFIVKPAWAELFGLGMIIVFGLITSFLLPRLGAKMGAIVGIGLMFVYAVGIFTAFAYGLWLNFTYPILLLVINYTAITSRSYLTVEKQKLVAELEGDEANKLLGLTFQGKGMLDLAFDKFKTIPVNEEMKGILYNLAQDFERKRMAPRALAVYEHISTADKEYKDIAERIEKLKTVSSTGVWQGPKAAAGGTVMMDGMEKPTIGRYEIVQELGRGAMGVVYKGVDPKINRQVAIKTVYFDEVDADTLQSIKERFFREAESAGKMTHPNIVTIYDVGEETDLAYIAMEFIEGSTLEGWCKKGSLLPATSVLKMIGQVCEALDYAHIHGIVHRDIKPANIMALKKGGVKVTDFGIARIQSSSHTKTGIVMGTPSYMSPEQVAGSKVDGRSDLFSLGVVLYEMLTGEKPFKGDSIATIMFQITTAPPPPVAEKNPDLHPILQSLLSKAMAKKPEERFQTGKEFANAVRVCLSKMEETGIVKEKV